MLRAAGVSTAISAAATAVVRVPQRDGRVLRLDLAAGITNMRFVIDGKLEDQGGVGFCPLAGRLNVAVRNGTNATRVYVELETRDSVDRPALVETDLAPSTSPVGANAAYFIWTLDLATHFSGGLTTHTIGAAVDGVKIVASQRQSSLGFSACLT
ncbi:hypothetical protein C8R43DRAFT_1141947 [Mycena crocata]|nr:hypothetical protein C8R43DRAFT_1141947 [Mycena crocata]